MRGAASLARITLISLCLFFFLFESPASPDESSAGGPVAETSGSVDQAELIDEEGLELLENLEFLELIDTLQYMDQGLSETEHNDDHFSLQHEDRQN